MKWIILFSSKNKYFWIEPSHFLLLKDEKFLNKINLKGILIIFQKKEIYINIKFKNFLKDKSDNTFFYNEIIQLGLKKINGNREILRLLFIICV